MTRGMTSLGVLASAVLIGAGCGDSSPAAETVDALRSDRSALAVQAARAKGKFRVTYRRAASGEAKHKRRL